MTTIAAPATRVRFGNLVRSELIKLTSLRSLMLALALLVVGGIGVTMLLALTMESAGLPDGPSVTFVASTITLGPVMFGQLVAAVIGVLAISSEYSSNSIQTTLAAAPSRIPALAAKAVVVFGAVFAAAAACVLLSWTLSFPLFDRLDLAIGLGEPALAIALLGAAGGLALTAVFSLGVGTIVRSAAGGIATVLGVLLVLPATFSLVGGVEGLLEVWPYLLSNAAQAMSTVPNGLSTPGAPLEPLVATLVVLAWSAVTLVLGAVVLRRRDA